MTSVAHVAPYVLHGHGFVLALEDADGSRLSDTGAAVVLSRGLPHGDDMCAQVDYAFARAMRRAPSVCVVVETRYPSFRFPDAALRALFAHCQRYQTCIDAVHFVGLSSLLRYGFQIFGSRALPAYLRDRVHVTTGRDQEASVAQLLGDVDPRAIVAWRAREEGLALGAARSFDERLLVSSARELRAARRRVAGA